MDTSLIPPGGYCYRVVRLLPGEALPPGGDRFGKDQREFPYAEGWKEVLCPYWYRTDYGMVQCRYLHIETLDEDAPEARTTALVHFGGEESLHEANHPSLLFDEIKVCGINEDEPEGVR